MSIIGILEVAIGMVFSWLVMSLAGMYLQEVIVSKLNWRSDMLARYINNMLADPILTMQLYSHPLIKGLHSGKDGEKKPSYIPSSQFSLALIDIIRNSSKDASLIQKTLFELQEDVSSLSPGRRGQAQKQLNAAISLTQKAIASDGGAEITTPLMDEVKKIIRKLSSDHPALQPKIEAKFTAFGNLKKQVDVILAERKIGMDGKVGSTAQDEFRTGLAVMSITHPEIKVAIEALSNEIDSKSDIGENSLQQTRINLENWFNNCMDRLSGWYKRRSQSLAFIIGIVLALSLNVDSLALTNQLWRDPTIRQALAAQADKLVKTNPDGLPNPDAGQLILLNNQINQLNLPVGWIGSGLPVSSNAEIPVGDGSVRKCTLSPLTDLDVYGFSLAGKCYPITNTPQSNDITGWLLKSFGILLTGIAAAQGAPFWFDILKKIINVRSTGSNPDAQGARAG